MSESQTPAAAIANGSDVVPGATDDQVAEAVRAARQPGARKAKAKAKDQKDPNSKPPVGRYRAVHRGMRDPYSKVEFNTAYGVPVDEDACTNWLQTQVLAGLIVKE